MLARFLIPNLFLSLLIAYRYVLNSATPDTLVASLFLHVALVSNFIVIYAFLTLPLVAIALILPHRRVILPFLVTVVCLLHAAVICDTVIHALFRFHVNGMVLDIIFTEGVWDSVHVGSSTLITASCMGIALVAAEVFLARYIARTVGAKSILAPARRWMLWGVPAIAVVIVIADKSIYAAADFFNNSHVLQYSRSFPLYQPLTIKRFMRNVMHVQVNREADIKVGKVAGTLRYPVAPLIREHVTPTPNILWVFIDAWRYDMLTPEVTPNIDAFARSATVYANHYSGGNATRFGVFSIFYGIYGTYWHQFLAERQSPVLLDTLVGLGYEMRIFSSTRLTFPDFRKTAFVHMPDAIEDQLPGRYADERDPKNMSNFLAWLKRRDHQRPFFSFISLDAPHGPYFFPPEHAVFKPYVTAANYVTVGRDDAPALMNSYRNALRFNDSLVGQALRALEADGSLTNTIVLISADHGEEFYEHGYLGHTSAWTREQNSIPLVLYRPGATPGTVTALTSHLDIVPYFMRLLGYTRNPVSDYSQGQPLDVARPADDFVVLSGWDNSAIVDMAHTLVFSTETYNLAHVEVRDAGYQPVDGNPGVRKRKRAQLVKVMNGFRQFLK